MRKRILSGRFLAAILPISLAWGGGEAIQFANWSWTVPNSADWKIDNSQTPPVLQLVVGREPPKELPRRPMQFALLAGHPMHSATVECDVMPLGRSVIIVFGYTDGAHFDYAHLSTDTGIKQPVHNGIFKVDGGERHRISDPPGPAAFPANKRWYHVLVHYDESFGVVNVLVDGNPIPALHAVDTKLQAGQVGIGSFDETGNFRNVRVSGRFGPANVE